MKYLLSGCSLIALTLAAPANAVLPNSCPVGICSTKDFGAICDGSSHPLSTRYGSLGAAQVDYPFVTSTGQEIDFAALQQTSNIAFGPLGSEKSRTNPSLNIPIYVQPGSCMLGTDTWEIRYLKGGRIVGASPLATQIQSNAKVMRFYGLWYSDVSDMGITRNAVSGSEPAFDIDGLTGVGTIGVQANTFTNLTVNGGGNAYAVSMCLTGGGSGQCSENTFINPHWSNATEAVYYQNGFNAIDNQFIGGDFQNYTKNGIRLTDGNVQIIGTSFESTTGYTQLANGGCDVQASDGGAYETVTWIGSRSESLCMYNGAFSQLANIKGVTHIPAGIGNFSALTPYSLNQLVSGSAADGKARAFRVTTAGTSGASAPTWPTSGTVTSGTVTFTEFNYNVITIAEGNADLKTSKFHPTADFVLGSLPSVSTCGTSPSVSGTRYSGNVIEGAGATGCDVDIRFWPAPHAQPNCAVSAANGVALSVSTVFNSSTTEWDLIWTHSGSPTTVSWVCEQ